MEESKEPVLGQLRGIGNRLDPQRILFAPEDINGLTWGYTVIDRTVRPTMFMAEGWREFVPEAIWIQMLEYWDQQIRAIKADPESFSTYLEYPEVAAAVEAI